MPASDREGCTAEDGAIVKDELANCLACSCLSGKSIQHAQLGNIIRDMTSQALSQSLGGRSHHATEARGEGRKVAVVLPVACAVCASALYVAMYVYCCINNPYQCIIAPLFVCAM